jgi:hypothetical protein
MNRRMWKMLEWKEEFPLTSLNLWPRIVIRTGALGNTSFIGSVQVLPELAYERKYIPQLHAPLNLRLLNRKYRSRLTGIKATRFVYSLSRMNRHVWDELLHPTAGGLGLGLSICRSTKKLHGGTITATSEGEGRGTSFALEFPINAHRRASAAEEKVTHPAPQQLGGNGSRILLVEDHPRHPADACTFAAPCRPRSLHGRKRADSPGTGTPNRLRHSLERRRTT